MRDIADGFWIGERLVPWGTTLGDAARLFDRRADETRSRGISLPGGLAYGLPALSAKLSGPAADRPVLRVGYDLADIGGLRAEDWIAAISDRLGPPESFDRRGLAERQRPEDAVILSAQWLAGDFSAGISIFGGPRQVEHGRSIGSFWLSWRHETAAELYLAEWNERSARLSASANTLTGIHIYTLAWPAQPSYGYGEEGLETEEGRQRRRRRLCLHAPEMLETPDAIARQLSDSRFAVWFHQPGRIWCASTLWETLVTSFDTPGSITWIEMLPAKGAGFSALEIGRWRVRSSEGSAEIADAAAKLEAFPGVKIVHHEGYNC